MTMFSTRATKKRINWPDHRRWSSQSHSHSAPTVSMLPCQAIAHVRLPTAELCMKQRGRLSSRSEDDSVAELWEFWQSSSAWFCSELWNLGPLLSLTLAPAFRWSSRNFRHVKSRHFRSHNFLWNSSFKVCWSSLQRLIDSCEYGLCFLKSRWKDIPLKPVVDFAWTLTVALVSNKLFLA